MVASRPVLRLHGVLSVVGGGPQLPDSITLSCQNHSRWLRRRRVVAAFKFSVLGWCWFPQKDVQRNTSAGAVVMDHEELQRRDGATAVQIRVAANGATVYLTTVTIADLQHMVACTQRGNEATLLFTMAGTTTDTNGLSRKAFTALFCNGKRCGLTDGGHWLPPGDMQKQQEQQPGAGHSPPVMVHETPQEDVCEDYRHHHDLAKPRTSYLARRPRWWRHMMVARVQRTPGRQSRGDEVLECRKRHGYWQNLLSVAGYGSFSAILVLVIYITWRVLTY